MAHSHSHGKVDSNYFLDQIRTVAVCGALAAVAVLAYSTGRFNERVLKPEFVLAAFYFGLVLLVLTMVRAVALWRLAGNQQNEDDEHLEAESHDHEHSHTNGHDGHEHAHSHAHEHDGHGHAHTHSHSHAHSHGDGGDGHEHAWAPWRYIVLMFPVVLFALNLGSGFSAAHYKERTQSAVEVGPPPRLKVALLAGGPAWHLLKKEGVRTLAFDELARHMATARGRDHFQGTMVRLRGQFIPRDDKVFTLFRRDMKCCAADEVYLKAVIIAPDTLQGYEPLDWVEIVGELNFQKDPQRNEWLPVISLESNQNIKPAEPVSGFGV